MTPCLRFVGDPGADLKRFLKPGAGPDQDLLTFCKILEGFPFQNLPKISPRRILKGFRAGRESKCFVFINNHWFHVFFSVHSRTRPIYWSVQGAVMEGVARKAHSKSSLGCGNSSICIDFLIWSGALLPMRPSTPNFFRWKSEILESHFCPLRFFGDPGDPWDFLQIPEIPEPIWRDF